MTIKIIVKYYSGMSNVDLHEQFVYKFLSYVQ